MTTTIGRWLIEGQLTLRSPLTLRSGSFTEIAVSEDDDPVQCADLQTDWLGRPFLPGSSLKGALRAWISARLGDRADGTDDQPSTLEQVFGHGPRPVRATGNDRDEVKTGRGGKAEFHDAFLIPKPGDENVPRHRLAQAAIDRNTRTARHRMLAHTDATPAGSCFAVIITADHLTEGELDLLLAALEGFNASPQVHGCLPITLGGSGGSGRGAAVWQLDSIRVMTPELIDRWLQESPPPQWHSWLANCADATRDKEAGRKRALKVLHDARPDALLAVPVRLRLAAPFLVNDPWRVEACGSDEPDLRPRLDEHGRALLPGTSVRGVLRAQSERIWRTVRGALDDAATALDGKPRNPIEWLFGVGGWQGTIAIADFRQPAGANAPLKPQEFVAIDRFTGGAADTAKFQACIAEAPEFQGQIAVRVRPGDLHAAKYAKPALGVLALVLRDLIEGDLTFGHGATKGMGACIAEITGPPVVRPGDLGVLKELLELRGDGKSADEVLPVSVSREEAQQIYGPMISACLEAFRPEKSNDRVS